MDRENVNRKKFLTEKEIFAGEENPDRETEKKERMSERQEGQEKVFWVCQTDSMENSEREKTQKKIFFLEIIIS